MAVSAQRLWTWQKEGPHGSRGQLRTMPVLFSPGIVSHLSCPSLSSPAGFARTTRRARGSRLPWQAGAVTTIHLKKTTLSRIFPQKCHVCHHNFLYSMARIRYPHFLCYCNVYTTCNSFLHLPLLTMFFSICSSYEAIFHPFPHIFFWQL